MNSYSSLDISISICRHVPLYQLNNYKNECDKIEEEINKVLKPSRAKVLRGYYLMNTLNKIIDKKSDDMLYEATNNAEVTKHIQILQDDISTVVTDIKQHIEGIYKTNINIIQDSDAQILSKFRDESKALDLVYIRNILTQIRTSTVVPINLTQNNMSEIGYNNKRIDENLLSLKKNGKKLSSTLSLSERHSFIKEVIYNAIKIHLTLEEEGMGDYLNTHSNNEVKEWLYGRIS